MLRNNLRIKKSYAYKSQNCSFPFLHSIPENFSVFEIGVIKPT